MDWKFSSLREGATGKGRGISTYTLQPVSTQVLDLLVACVPNIADLAGLVALVQTDTQFVSETHG